MRGLHRVLQLCYVLVSCSSDAEDPESLSLLREVVEIFVSMGLVEQTEFKRIKCFVSSSLLTRGRFEVPVQVPLLEYLYQSDVSLPSTR